MKEIKREPTAKLSVNKSLLKKYRVESKDVYFLQNGINFEIELFNPLQETILCNFAFNNGKVAAEGLVLKPGERVFLERYLDTNNKFVFETYKVEDSEESKYATAYNGLIEITFHKEREVWNYNANWNNWDNNWPPLQPIIYPNSPNIFYCASETRVTNKSETLTTANFATLPIDTIIDTGRIEKGDASNQVFTYTNKDFEIASFHSVDFKLIPDSQRPKTTEDLKIRTYCTQCGKKSKSKDKFCSKCGNKL